jgi:hypothetical protein
VIVPVLGAQPTASASAIDARYAGAACALCRMTCRRGRTSGRRVFIERSDTVH